ncbi:EVE domain-containing protein [Geomesophilobacter sediminis]|uniref:EVE domain-containing protein n=1 Tax=Geomesophilobacter sediminis TaxID=2798584 RepID=A0A8J7M357_9BACT|nr:EVE domain-containing protein [Geomesophilobacter sediminis]MBJ6727782.1 EVE domain-containing protein [Geomesophilobacter sediminis]
MAYWLFKTEPSAFSLEDLKSRPNQTEHWDGVRNYQARNFLRDAVALGDLVFIYHSNIAQPAVVGIAEVVRAGYPDHTALNPQGDHFDPKATPQNPIWYMVDVRYRQALATPVTLEQIKQIPQLSDMPLVKRSRLSIQPVTPQQWETILRLGSPVP